MDQMVTFNFYPAVLPRKYCLLTSAVVYRRIVSEKQTLCTLIRLLMEPSGSGSFCLQYRPLNYIINFISRRDVVISGKIVYGLSMA